jgi:hypothetical protein
MTEHLCLNIEGKTYIYDEKVIEVGGLHELHHNGNDFSYLCGINKDQYGFNHRIPTKENNIDIIHNRYIMVYVLSGNLSQRTSDEIKILTKFDEETEEPNNYTIINKVYVPIATTSIIEYIETKFGIKYSEIKFEEFEDKIRYVQIITDENMRNFYVIENFHFDINIILPEFSFNIPEDMIYKYIDEYDFIHDETIHRQYHRHKIYIKRLNYWRIITNQANEIVEKILIDYPNEDELFQRVPNIEITIEEITNNWVISTLPYHKYNLFEFPNGKYKWFCCI